MKTYLFFTFIIFQVSSYGESFSERDFITYDEVINELQSADTISNIEYKYDYSLILLLDSSNIDLIETIDYSFIDDFRDYALGLPLSDQTVGFVVDSENITKIFQDKNSLKRILDCFNRYSPMAKLTYPIYVKENEAIFEITEADGSDIYVARYNSGVLQINWLGGITE